MSIPLGEVPGLPRYKHLVAGISQVYWWVLLAIKVAASEPLEERSGDQSNKNFFTTIQRYPTFSEKKPSNHAQQKT